MATLATPGTAINRGRIVQRASSVISICESVFDETPILSSRLVDDSGDRITGGFATAGSRGVIARRYPFNYVQSVGKVTTEGPVPGNVSLQVSEENPRQFYRRWRDYMNAADWDTLLGRKDTQPASFVE